MNLALELAKLLVPFGAALLAYWLGLQSYRRQKEFELVRERYLEEGLDRTSAQIEAALSASSHNFLHGMRVLKVFRDIGPGQAVPLVDGGFKGVGVDSLELVALSRFRELVQDDVFWEVRQLLYSGVHEYQLFLAEDLGATIKVVHRQLSEGKPLEEVLKKPVAEVLHEYEARVVDGYREMGRFMLLLTCLHDITSVFQVQKLDFASISSFHRQRVVAESAARLKAEFEKDIKPLDEELKRMGLS